MDNAAKKKNSIGAKWNKFYGNLTVDDKVAISFAILTFFVFLIIGTYPEYLEPIWNAYLKWADAHPFLDILLYMILGSPVGFAFYVLISLYGW